VGVAAFPPAFDLRPPTNPRSYNRPLAPYRAVFGPNNIGYGYLCMNQVGGRHQSRAFPTSVLAPPKPPLGPYVLVVHLVGSE
jgi:hypothetical protein